MRGLLGVAGLALMALSGPALADASYACSRDEVVRTVSIVTGGASGRACEVKYQKSAAEQPSTLWHADSDQAFCTKKANELVERLSGAGWSCAQQSAQSAPPAQVTARAEPAPAAPEPQAQAAPAPSGVTGAVAPRQPMPVQEIGPGERQPIDPGNIATDGRLPIDPSIKLRPTIH